MTKITRTIVRETDIEWRGRKLVGQMLPRYIEMWPKGTKQIVRVPWDAVYELGKKIHARGLK
jgi:hypothetical protein